MAATAFGTHRFIFRLQLGNDFGLCLNRNSRKPSTYFSKYRSQWISVTSKRKLSRSRSLMCVSKSRTLSSVHDHWCVVKYSRHSTAFDSLSCTFTMLSIGTHKGSLQSTFCHPNVSPITLTSAACPSTTQTGRAHRRECSAPNSRVSCSSGDSFAGSWSDTRTHPPADCGSHA